MLAISLLLSVTVILPFAGLIYALKSHHLKVYFVGGLAFIVSQLLVRMPLLSLLSTNSLVYHHLQASQPVLVACLVGLSAGLFEEVTRYLFMNCYLKKYWTWQDGVLFGLGHGSTEALIIVGLPIVGSIFLGGFSTLSSSQLVLAAVERLLAILLHIGLSLLVMRGLTVKRMRYLGIAILIHGVVDAAIGIIPLYVSNSLMIIEGGLALVSIGVFGYCLIIRRDWGNK